MSESGTFIKFILSDGKKIYSEDNDVLCNVKIQDKQCEMWVPASSLVNIDMTNEDSAQIEDCKLSDDRKSVNESMVTEEEIWSSRKPKPQDVKATEDLLNIVSLEHIQKQLLDKRTPKHKIWENIALKLIDHGYVVGKSLKDSGMKCHQKWRNLEKSYMVFIQNSKKTGTGKIKNPPFFDLLHSILGNKHKVKPPILLDTLDLDMTEFDKTEVVNPTNIQKRKDLCDEDIDAEGPSHFKNIKNSSKPKDLKKELIDEMRLQHQEDMAMQKKLIDVFEQSINEQKEQRLILNNALSAIVDSLKKK